MAIGAPAINDYTRTPTQNHFNRFTSLNHTIHFHVHDGFRADSICYVEVNSPWTSGRRAEVQSRIFDQNGQLLATCVQEAYYVQKSSTDGARL
jgi:acyl-CoA thioesterase II